MLTICDTSKWFEMYIEGFLEQGTLCPMLALKERHSRRVADVCCDLAKSMGWNSEREGFIAHAVGLLHDVGRFPQYRDYGTFFDGQSVDHGDLAAQILEKDFPSQNLPSEIMDIIITSVKFHNKKDLPEELPKEQKRWAALVRDGDKTDIFRMVQRRIDNGTIYDMLPRHKIVTGLNPDLVDEVSKNGKGSYANAHSLQDYRLIQLTWGCDLNYPIAVSILRKDGIFERIKKDLEPYGIDALVSRLIDKIYSMERQ